MAAALALAGCGNGSPAETRAATAAPVAGTLRVPCAAGAGPLAPVCTAERAASPDGALVTLRRADGGFRRLRIVGDGRGLVAADGAQPAGVSVAGPDRIDVRIGDERYRLPATVGAR